MKGRISANLRHVLADEKARGALRALLVSGKDGRVQLDGRIFKVSLRNSLTREAPAVPRKKAG